MTDDTDDDDCTICLEPIEEEIYSLNCQHKYHRDCITRWLHTNPNCPLCRQPVDADQRYVNDGIMTEERRQYIENLKTLCLMTAQGLEWLFPQGLEGYSEKATELLESDEGKEMLDTAGGDMETPVRSLPIQLLMALGSSGITQFIANGGLTRWFSEPPQDSSDDSDNEIQL
jgi:hypothetical protein